MNLKPGIVAVLGNDALIDLDAAKRADVLEVRLDLIDKDPLETLRSIRRLTAQPIIVTNRMKSEGGYFEGTEDERINILLLSANYADYVDIELRAPLRDDVISKVKKPMIVSFHDFSRMPDRSGLEAILDEIKCTDAAIAKIAVTPKSMKDNLLILDFLLESEVPLCIIAMGPLGRHLRAIAPLYGSMLTYGYVSKSTAPGQLSVQDLRNAMDIFDKES